ncbi:DUF2125 domain-containing protein [Tropicimonas sp. TH_r6]|uniref:DUF2125 domain-containing protein n=1 Tax=Tropicimonas sp. TH_r6 TaxID=3082085 RepID=UPI002954E1C4|nr:DUF2125 domain-containing protein [Tropicimonas sp. TH_r6]MDV7145164.1 DUF2125 domain-containing protein [Tropicimonas sp. TH_r6]
MKPWILGSVSAAAFIAIPAAGWSLTAQEAWEKWQTAAASYGQEMTNDGEQTMDGKLTIRGVALNSDVDGMTVAVKIDEVSFAEQDDGSVAVTLSDSFPLTVNGTDPESGEKVDAVVTVAQPGMTMTASDADGGTAFSYDAPSLSVSLTELKVDDVAIPMQITVALNDTLGNYAVKAEAGSPMESSFEAAGIVVDIDVSDPEGPGKLSVDATIDGITSTSFASGLDSAETEDMAKMLADGFAVEGKAEYGPVSFAFDFDESGETAKANGSLTGGGIDFGLNADGMRYDVGYEGLDVAVSGSEIPFPQVTVKAAAAATRVMLPVLQTESAEPFAFRTALEGLELGEEIWSLFDPAAVLPRDPATLIVDLAGTGRWTLDIFDEEAMLAVESSGETPGELETVELKELMLSVGGAELSGTGAFKIDNTDMETFGGVPRPEGTANVRLVGGNGLLDNLTKMGLVPEDQVMMVRMMTGMFAKPGPGQDELLSEITVDGNGQLLINGAPMPF